MAKLIRFAALAVLLAGACDRAKVSGGSGGAGPGGGGGGSGGLPPSSERIDGPVLEVSPPEALPPAPDTGPGGEVCAENSIKAERVPVDLLLLIDASSSMAAAAAGMASKYQLVREGLMRFVRDPASAGLGLGLQFFPQPGSGSPCGNSADCGFPVLAPTPPPCQPVRACANSVAGGSTRMCGTGNCAAGDSCVPLGRCRKSLNDCTNVGQLCPGGGADDTCVGRGSACTQTDSPGCDVALYRELVAPITALPMPAERLIARGLDDRGPSGSTPLRPAVEGALGHLRQHLMANPGRRGSLVLASDGAPSGCSGNTVPATAGLLAQARMGNPPIDSYVIGVYTPDQAAERTVIESLATAGGTGMPLVIRPNEDLARGFLETLSRIRGQALPCELQIPPPKSGASALDFGKVNLRFQGATSSGPEDVLYAGSAARCDAQRGGWYYDVDPSMGTPTRIIVCEATCRRWKSDPAATVDLRIGCRTRVID